MYSSPLLSGVMLANLLKGNRDPGVLLDVLYGSWLTKANPVLLTYSNSRRSVEISGFMTAISSEVAK